MGGMAAAGGGIGIMGGILGGIGDIYKATHYERPKFPKATKAENRMRRASLQDLQNARSTLYGAKGMYDQTLPMMYNAIPGVSAKVSYDPQAQADYQSAYDALSGRVDLQDELAAAQAEKRGARARGEFKGKAGKALRKTARGKVREVKGRVKGAPKLSELERALYTRTAQGPQLDIEAEDPSQRDLNAETIQDEMSNRTLAALRGETPNPTLERDLAREQAALEQSMQSQLGPDWQNSSAGMEALQRFNQYAGDRRDMSNRRDIEQLYEGQLRGQGANLGFAGNMQKLLGNPSMGELDFMKGMGSSANWNVNAQSPYQFDRQGGWQEQQNPSQIYGDMMAQSGNRWASIGSSMSGGGGGSQTGAAPQGGSGVSGGWGGGGMSSGEAASYGYR